MSLSLNEKGLFKNDTTKSVFIHLYNKLAQFKCQAIKSFILTLNIYLFLRKQMKESSECTFFQHLLTWRLGFWTEFHKWNK